MTPAPMRVEYFGGPWDGRVDHMAPATVTQRRHMPGRTDGHPADLATYVLAGRFYLYRPNREDT